MDITHAPSSSPSLSIIYAAIRTTITTTSNNNIPPPPPPPSSSSSSSSRRFHPEATSSSHRHQIRLKQEEGLQFKVRASCVEIYNESVIDLIKSSRFAKGASLLPVKFDPSKGSFFVQDISYGKCPTEVELLRLYMKALRNRSVAAHELNRDSSRSHVLFTVYIDSMVKDANGELCPLISSAILGKVVRDHW